MRKFQCLLFVLKRSYIYFIICMTVPLKALYKIKRQKNKLSLNCEIKLLQKKKGKIYIFENDSTDKGAVFNTCFTYFSILSIIISSGNILDL